VQPADAVATSQAAILDPVNASLNAMNVLQADFVQTGANVRRSEGRLSSWSSQGKIRFEYADPPNPGRSSSSDGTWVTIREPRQAEVRRTYTLIGQTPLKFLVLNDDTSTSIKRQPTGPGCRERQGWAHHHHHARTARRPCRAI
jgi:outer membrane lipoprotein-sorting protein